MNGIKVNPSRSVLIQLRQEEEFVKGGKEILSRKREVLVTEMLALKEQAETLRKEVADHLAHIYEHYRCAVSAEGREPVLRLSTAIEPVELSEVTLGRIMGIRVPQVAEIEQEPFVPNYSLQGLNADTDKTILKLRELIPLLFKLAAKETSLCRLADEVRKTLQREKALETIFLPEFKKKIGFIEDSLEEREREEYSRIKLLKNRRG